MMNLADSRSASGIDAIKTPKGYLLLAMFLTALISWAAMASQHDNNLGNGKKGSTYGWLNFVLAMGIIAWLAIMAFLALMFTGNQLEPIMEFGINGVLTFLIFLAFCGGAGTCNARGRCHQSDHDANASLTFFFFLFLEYLFLLFINYKEFKDGPEGSGARYTESGKVEQNDAPVFE